MISSEFESESDVLDCSISETLTVTSESDSSFNNGAAETTRKLKNFRSIKLVKLPSIRLKSPNYMKTTSSSTAKKGNFQKLARNLTRHSSFKPPRSLTRLPSTKFRRPLMRKSSGGSDLRKMMSKSRSIKLRNRSSVVLSHDGENSQFQARTSSIRPLRMLKKMSSLRINRSSMKKSSQMLDRNIHRATCSSTLKGSKFPNHLELQSGGSESQGISTIKVCPYTYCSLHGHSHSTLPPLKRFVSIRRRVLRTQTSVKLERQSSVRAKRSSNVKKGIRGRKMSDNKDSAVPETSNASKVLTSTRKMAGPNMEDTCSRDGEGTSCCSESVPEDMLAELSDPLLFVEGGRVESNSPKHVLNEEISVTGEVQHEVNEEKSSTLNLADCGGDLELITLEENASAGEVSSSRDNTISSSSEQLGEESAAYEENDGDCFPKKASVSDYNTRVADKSKMENQNHMGLWHLIYKHMASGIAAEDEVQAPAAEIDNKEVEDADTCPGMNKASSSDFSGTKHGLDVDNNHEEGSHIQLYQQNAIKLVKEAFDKILSEIPDQSLDDQSSDSGSTQNKEFTEKNHNMEESINLTSFNSRKEGTAQEREKTMLNTDINNGLRAEKTQSEMGSKSKQETPRNWSYLKKILVLNKFVKELDKAKKFNPRKPRFLPIPSDPEAEKVQLRHQSLEEKKKTEEWMLDYALQQVISTLAPSQKRKVALLVQAFETVGPSPSSDLDASSYATQDETCIGLSNQKSSGKGEETYFGISLHKASFPNKKSDENLNHISGSCTEEQDPDSFSKLKELNLECSCTSAALSPQTAAAGSKKTFGVINLDNNSHNSIVNDVQPDSIKDVANTLSDVLENGDYFPKTDTESDDSTRAEDKSEMGKQKHMGLWHLIYKHMASGIPAEDEVQEPATGTDNEEVEDGSSDLSGIDHGLDVDNNHEQGSHIQLYQRNAIKLVKEAFDKILSEIPDQPPDDQSSDRSSTRNKEFTEKSHDGKESSIPTSFNSSKEVIIVQSEKTMLNTYLTDGLGLENTQSKMRSKSKEEAPRNWSYLKKVLVLNRFIKALDKVKKFNPQKPQFLPILSDPKAEKVHLRHQSCEEKKKYEEWMLDYALQQVISTLAPSQKRKVSLLIQAFESVGPSPSPALDASSHATQDESSTGLSNQKSSGKGEEAYFGISLRKTSLPKKSFDENLHHINDSFTEEEADPDALSVFKELKLESSCTSAALISQITAEGSEKTFGVVNLDNNDHNSTVKDDQPDSITCYLVQDAPKRADVANTSNDVLGNREVSESEVHDLDLEFNDQQDVVDTTNDVFADTEVSVSEVHDLDPGFNDQHDIAITENAVLANTKVSSSEACDRDLGLNDQHDVANTSNYSLASGEISESEVHDQHDAANTSNDILANGEVSAPEVHDLGLVFSDQRDVADTSNDVLVIGEVSSCEVLDLYPGFNKQQLSSNYQMNGRVEQQDDPESQILQSLEDSSANRDVNSLVSVPELVGKSSNVTKGETVLRNKFLQLIVPQSQHEESKGRSTELTHEKQKNMGLWHLIYKHMVSGTTTLLDEAEHGNHVIVSQGMNSTDDVHQVAGSQKVDFQKIEAIRMVEEAIDEIPLPDFQDDLSDDHPITSDVVPDRKKIEKQPGAVSVNTETIQSTAPDPKELCLNSRGTATEDGEKNAFGVGNKTKKQTKKSWSNLKKMILLRRFVTAMEKVKEFNLRPPRLLPLDSEKEAEKVLLRHQDMEDRKNGDEWMLDYTLQQVVAKLTPARKRKVQLLVEAFETVIPSIET